MAERKNIRDERKELRQEIGRSRARLNDTIEEIMDRFSSGRLKDRAWDEIRAMTAPGSRARDTGSTLVDTVRNNPIPAAMAGAGLILLFARGPGGRHAGPGITAVEEEGHEVSGKVRDISQKARQKAASLKGRADEKARYAGGQIGEKAREARGIFADLLENNPLAMAAAAFAVGSALGFSLPETGKERELPGGASGPIMEKAAEAAGKAAKKAEEETGRAA